MSFGIPSGSLPGNNTKNHSFSMVPHAEIPRSVFNRSHTLKTTFDSGYLIPIYADEALPGDTFNLNMTTFARMATPIKPVMDNLYCDVQFFAVPLRLIWENFKQFMGEAPSGSAIAAAKLCPTMTAPAVTGALVGSLSDYLGIKTGVASLVFDSFWHRAYNLIWNEWYRDQNLQTTKAVVDIDDGPDTYTDYVLLKRGKRHDYFTSCLPWPQKGTAVTLPLGTEAPIKGLGKKTTVWSTGPIAAYEKQGSTNYAKYTTTASTVDDTTYYVEEDPTTHYPNLRADLTNATAATINQLRQAFQIQRLYERDARGGSRYTEIVRSHFGVTSPDARLQRPEYLGGGSSMITITPIPQTAPTAAGVTPMGTLAGMGTHAANKQGFSKSFTEHCVLLGLASVRADLTYNQGLPRMFSRQSRWDFYWPALSHIGEQAVLNKEIYAQGTADDALTFGYQERYAEYRYKPSMLTGLFRTDAAGTLDIWHLGQHFAGLPSLGSTFIEENPPVDRVVAVPSEPEFLLDAYFDLKCARPMPIYSVPGLIDHF